MVSGVYIIQNIANGKFYIGSSCDIIARWNSHKRDLRGNRHGNKHLQHAWNKYGEVSFIWCILDYVQDVNLLLEREQYWMDNLNAFELGYNMTKYAGALMKGINHTAETREKMRTRWSDPELRQNLSRTRKVLLADPKQREKMSNIMKERWSNPEYRQKVSDAQKTGWAAKDKNAMEEHRNMQSQRSKAQWADPEYRRKYSETRKGGTHNEETRKKIGEASKRRSKDISERSKAMWADPKMREDIMHTMKGKAHKRLYKTKKSDQHSSSEQNNRRVE